MNISLPFNHVHCQIVDPPYRLNNIKSEFQANQANLILAHFAAKARTNVSIIAES